MHRLKSLPELCKILPGWCVGFYTRVACFGCSADLWTFLPRSNLYKDLDLWIIYQVCKVFLIWISGQMGFVSVAGVQRREILGPCHNVILIHVKHTANCRMNVYTCLVKIVSKTIHGEWVNKILYYTYSSLYNALRKYWGQLYGSLVLLLMNQLG